jgi:DNA-directed RNA polymerase II subunit RPB3
MNAKIENLTETDSTLTFTLKGVDVSFANAIRRTILSDIPTVVFKTMPYEENKSNILENTSRLNNEIIKQRLSCIPIHIKDIDMPLKDYILDIDEENKTDTIMMVTTQHFKIKNKNTNKYLEEKDVRAIFPPYVASSGKGEYFIDFVRLRPKISDDLPGEKLQLTCEFSVGTAKQDSMFNITGTCAYGYTPDPVQIKEELEKHKQKWKNEGKTTDEIDYESKNWALLEGLRYVIKNSFDFIIETVGVYDNEIIVIKACDILINKLNKLNTSILQDELIIKPSINTMDNSYDIILENEDYTIGNILNYILYTIFYRDTKQLSYCGFKKMHPHDLDSIIRLAFESPTANKGTIKTMFKYAIEESIKVFSKIKEIMKPDTDLKYNK